MQSQCSIASISAGFTNCEVAVDALCKQHDMAVRMLLESCAPLLQTVAPTLPPLDLPLFPRIRRS